VKDFRGFSKTESVFVNFGWKKTVIYSLLPLLALLVLLEGAGRVIELWRPPWKVDYGWGFDSDSKLFIPSPTEQDFMMTNPSKEVSFQKERFEARKPQNVFRIFMLGGSSVNYLFGWLKGVEEAFGEEFDSKVRFEVIDCGGLAYGTHRLVPILSEVMNYEPDLILIYSGHNEFEELEQSRFVNLKSLPLQKVLYKSAFCRLIRDGIAALEISKVQKEKNGKILSVTQADYQSGAAHHYTKEEVEERMISYRNNLSLMMEMCASKNVPVIIGTVASNMWKPDLPTNEQEKQVQDLYAQGKYEEGYALAREILRTSERHQASDAENDIIRELAEKYHAPVADVLKAVSDAEPHHIPGETLHGDRCHLNPKGNDILVETYMRTILDLLKNNPAFLRK
jgi:hypothetical protein